MLKKTFPKVQFIAASHSPQIIGELAASEVWLMRDAQVLGNPERALGLSSGEVLEELTEVSQLDPEAEGEEDERAFFDVSEFVRVSVMLLYEDLRERDRAEHPTLH